MKDIKPKFRYSKKAGTIYIESGYSCYETICAATQKTSGGNVIHNEDIRQKAIALFLKPLNQNN